MILGLGTDLVENHRIRQALDRFGDRFLNRVYSEEEIQYSLSHEDPVPYLSARFAVKEAAIKALNLTEQVGLSYQDVQVGGKVFGKKKLILSRKARELADGMGVNQFHISLSHTDGMSMAVVILEG
ncbi:MAG: holo-[acyl-carrier-protein] synthase [Spirochaetaceae bacterium]|nr:holo-[acyl-carrier-protein] synthase [Spirochaetaceae bacterium]|tara:strand:+ start:17936 stop:18313 length:378 start_codon:yes stop_codon:yes gene_type:complete